MWAGGRVVNIACSVCVNGIGVRVAATGLFISLHAYLYSRTPTACQPNFLAVDVITSALVYSVPMIYFVQLGTDGPIKIGYAATSVTRRLASLQSAQPHRLRLLKRTDGSMQDERALHAKFAAFRLRGEWFEPVAVLLSHMATLPDSLVEEPPAIRKYTALTGRDARRKKHKPGPKPRPIIAKAAWQAYRPKPLKPLAETLGISLPAVSKWPYVPRERLDATAAFLNVEPRDLRPDLFPPPWKNL